MTQHWVEYHRLMSLWTPRLSQPASSDEIVEQMSYTALNPLLPFAIEKQWLTHKIVQTHHHQCAVKTTRRVSERELMQPQHFPHSTIYMLNVILLPSNNTLSTTALCFLVAAARAFAEIKILTTSPCQPTQSIKYSSLIFSHKHTSRWGVFMNFFCGEKKLIYLPVLKC